MALGKYDRQLIVALLDGPADAITAQQAEDLNAKQRKTPVPSEVVALGAGAAAAGPGATGADAALRSAMRGAGEVPLPVSARSRVYLAGRGDWPRQTLSGWTAEQVADLLVRCGLTAARVVSVVADELGRDRGSAAAGDLREPPDSFASRLHAVLSQSHGIETELLARVYPTAVVGAGPARGTKRTLSAADTAADGVHRRPHSKLRFTWRNGLQRREWSDGEK
jgi:hypothetical protein